MIFLLNLFQLESLLKRYLSCDLIQDVGKEVEEIQNAMGSSIDVSFDCVGYNKTMTSALNATRSGGKVCLIGLAQSEMTVPITPAAAR